MDLSSDLNYRYDLKGMEFFHRVHAQFVFAVGVFADSNQEFDWTADGG
jgi:hypothetical protein